MEAGSRVIWTGTQQKQLKALGFAYDEKTERWAKHETDHDEFVKTTAQFLYWFDSENTNGGAIRGNNRFPIMDFDALIIFLRAIQAIERLRK